MISIICALGKNRAIGKQNKLLWNLPGDMKHFRETTKGHTVIMGKNTHLSIGRPLPNRTNIVISKPEEHFEAAGCLAAHSIDEALELAKKQAGEIFIIGGGMIYSQFLPLADKLYLTLVDDAPADADVFFPDYSEFKTILSEEEHEENGVRYKFVELTR
jgi:dihydrofolate reductase